MANLYLRSSDGNDSDTGATWALADATLDGPEAVWTETETVYVSDNHAETAGAAKSWVFPTTPGLRIICVDDAAEPPTTYATTGTITTTGNFGISFVSGFAEIYGLTFRSGTGASGAADMLFASSTSVSCGLYFEDCIFDIPSTSTVAPFQMGMVNNASRHIECVDCTFKFGSVLPVGILFGIGTYIFRNLTIDSAGSTPTTLFGMIAGANGISIEIYSSDLSGEAVTNLFSMSNTGRADIMLRNCKLPASVALYTSTFNPGGRSRIRMHNCDSGDVNIRFAEAYYEGDITHSTSIYISGGSDDASGDYSQKMVTSAGASFAIPLRSMPWTVMITSAMLGASKNIAAHVAIDGSSTARTNAQIWIEIEVMTSSGTPLGVIVTDRKADVMATAANQASSAETWTGLSGTNRLHKLDASFTPQEVGYAQVRVCVAEVSLDALYVGKFELT